MSPEKKERIKKLVENGHGIGYIQRNERAGTNQIKEIRNEVRK